MAEVWFYHLDGRPPESVLPPLLQKCLERGWRTVVQAGSRERLEAIDGHLWTFSDDAFLPHGTAADGHEADQPVFLTEGDDNPNGAVVRVLVDRAPPPGDLSGYERILLLFDGSDPDALAEARTQWKAVKAAGHVASYWQQGAGGRWEKKG